MIFDILPTHDNKTALVEVVYGEAWDLMQLLSLVFPDDVSYHMGCYNGNENCVVFD